jgi:hypothetical protein
MAEIERLRETSELKTTRWRNIMKEGEPSSYIKYDNRVDALCLLFVPPDTPTIVHYIDDHVALLYTPDDMEIVGVRIEDFERGFMNKYSNLQQAWRLSDKCNIEDFGDLIIATRRFEIEKRKVEKKLSRELSHITHEIAGKKGIELPVFA